MGNAATYRIIVSGEVQAGRDATAVEAAFIKLFKIDPAKARPFFEGIPRVLRKDLSQEMANKYLGALNKIGVEAELVVEPEPAAPAQPDAAPNAATAADAPPAATAEQAGQPEAHAAGQGEAIRAEEDEIIAPDSLGLAAIGAAAVAALLGAWVWQIIATVFGYEIGIVAWAIGGAVGFAAAVLGAKGNAAGLVCGALALVAILGGKYWSVQSFQAQIADVMANEETWNQEAMGYFEEVREDAAIYRQLDGSDQSIREFMVERGYSGYDTAADVTAEELDVFYEYDDPTLTWMIETAPNFEEWQTHTMQAVTDITELSTLDLMTEGLGILDVVFLLLGVGTAFRLGSGQRE